MNAFWRFAPWVGFHLFVLTMLVVDLGIARRRDRAPTTREATLWTLVWVALSLALGGAIFWTRGPQRGTEFLTGYVVEYALSVDNLFVFLLIFQAFRVAPQFRHRLLFWGIIGEFALRAPLLVVGTQVVRLFQPILYVFGLLLVWSGIKMAISGEQGEAADPEKGWITRFARRVLPLSESGDRLAFWVREDGRLKFTPMFLVLVVINITDLMFAFDSIPAVLGVTQDPFVAYTSNVCAIFGLRSLFSVVASLMERFRFLKVAVSVILVFVGGKMIASHWVEVPILASLAVVVGCLGLAIAASALWPKRAT